MGGGVGGRGVMLFVSLMRGGKQQPKNKSRSTKRLERHTSSFPFFDSIPFIHFHVSTIYYPFFPLPPPPPPPPPRLKHTVLELRAKAFPSYLLHCQRPISSSFSSATNPPTSHGFNRFAGVPVGAKKRERKERRR